MDATLIAAAISELARNILQYAKRGKIVITTANGGRAKIVVVASDEGAGIEDMDRTLALTRVRRLMDEFEISSVPGKGTTVTTTLQKR
jgi:serine/threonine-protein kinase RsbT